MSTFLATVIALVLCGAALAPMAWALRGGKARIVAGGYATAIMTIAVYQTGSLAASRLTSTSGIVIAPVSRTDERCAEIRRAIQEAGLSLDESDPHQSRIVGPNAEQIPEQIREVVIGCLATAPPAPQARSSR